MNLDDTASFANIDREDMLSEIDALPAQLEAAWKLGSRLELPDWKDIGRILITGMGGSAIGGDLLAAYAAPTGKAPIYVYRDYGLPAWAAGAGTLVIASSHSGNTEETLQTYHEALESGCKSLAITTGGMLEEAARKAGAPLWKFQHQGQPRAAVGFSFTLLLAALSRLRLLPDPSSELDGAIQAMQKQQEQIQAEMPIAQNPAKRLAGQLMGRWVTIIGAGLLAPVARRWKTQINEIAKAWSQFEYLPEADHNTLAGILEPEDRLTHLIALFLQSPSDHPRNRLRIQLTRQSFMQQGLNTDLIEAQGERPLAQLWTCLHLGDYTAYYLAMSYGMDPTPVEAIESFKREMKAAG